MWVAAYPVPPYHPRNQLLTTDPLPSTDQTLVERLLAERVDISVTDAQGRTALLHSVIRKHDGITHLILAHHSELVRSRLNERKGSKWWGRSSSGQRGGEEAGMGEGSGVPEAVPDLQVGTNLLLAFVQRDLTTWVRVGSYIPAFTCQLWA